MGSGSCARLRKELRGPRLLDRRYPRYLHVSFIGAGPFNVATHLGLGLIWGHVIAVWSLLELESLCYQPIMFGVSGKTRIVQQSRPSKATFPPVVRLSKDTDGSASTSGAPVQAND